VKLKRMCAEAGRNRSHIGIESYLTSHIMSVECLRMWTIVPLLLLTLYKCMLEEFSQYV